MGPVTYRSGCSQEHFSYRVRVSVQMGFHSGCCNLSWSLERVVARRALTVLKTKLISRTLLINGKLHLFQGFFEEIEDLKYALQQAARLNSAYEKALKQLCSQCGVAFPKITTATTTPKQRHRKRTRSQAREFTGR